MQLALAYLEDAGASLTMAHEKKSRHLSTMGCAAGTHMEMNKPREKQTCGCFGPAGNL